VDDAGAAQPGLKPGIAIQVLRECLTGLAACTAPASSTAT